MPASELVAETDTGIPVRDAVGQIDTEDVVVGRQHGTVREATELLLPGYAGIHVDMPGEAPVNRRGDHVSAAGATGRGSAVGGASSSLIGIGNTGSRNIGELASRNTGPHGEVSRPLAVVRRRDIQGRGDRILHADPEHVQILVGAVE